MNCESCNQPIRPATRAELEVVGLFKGYAAHEIFYVHIHSSLFACDDASSYAELKQEAA